MQCFSSQMETIFRNPEYSQFLTEKDKSKFKNVQKALSIKESVIQPLLFAITYTLH